MRSILTQCTILIFVIMGQPFLTARGQETFESHQKSIIGSTVQEVNCILKDWRSRQSRLGSNYRAYLKDVKILIRFRQGIAIGAGVCNFGLIGISKARFDELKALIGGPTPEVKTFDGKIVEFYIGDVE